MLYAFFCTLSSIECFNIGLVFWNEVSLLHRFLYVIIDGISHNKSHKSYGHGLGHAETIGSFQVFIENDNLKW